VTRQFFGRPVDEFDPQALIRRREEFGWSTADLAAHARVAYVQIWRYEHGLIRPSRSRVAHLAAVLKCRGFELCKQEELMG
jgi:transcriptional regulator with XRE-family HTH domain